MAELAGFFIMSMSESDSQLADAWKMPAKVGGIR
jgi:hypothetical protein